MARIPDEEIDRLKRQTDLAALVRSRGVELHKHGSKDFAGKCPFHQDDKPSFIVTPDKGLFHCMGCGVAGNCIQFVERFDGVSFRHAFEILAEGRGFVAAATEPLKRATVPRLELPFDPETDDAGLMRQVVDYYHERLLKTPAAVDYLKGRGLYHEEALEKFRLGFADRTLGLRLPDKNRKEGEAIRTRLQKLGIVRESGHEHFTGCIVLPIWTGDGLGEMYGRRITKPCREAPPHLYLPGPHEGIWNAEALDEPELILCEAALDALTFWVNGFKNVTFIYGTEGFLDLPKQVQSAGASGVGGTDTHMGVILKNRIKRVYLAYDADDAGNRAVARDAERFLAHGIEVYRVKFPHGMDANEYACKVAPAAKALQAALNAAEWCGGSSSRTHAACHAEASCVGGGASSLIAASLLAAKEKEQPKATTPDEPQLERAGEYHVMKLGTREYRVGGLEKNNSLEVMKVSVRLRSIELFHLDSFDLLRDGERRRFIERAAEETRLEKELIKRDLGKLLLALEEEQQARLNAALKPETGNLRPEMTAEEKEEALAFLKSPDLVEKIGEAFDVCGLVGEGANRLAAYLACTSRKLGHPLAVIIQSTSAAGKSTLMEAVLSMFPEEERIKYSAMTGQSLYYLGETNLKHKILAIVEEEGAEKASYALKLLQSEGELTIASTGKDPTTGRMETQEYHVEGPVMIFLTTTAVEIDEELLNRCLILTVDESREQTERIHALQRKARTLEGLVAREEKKDLLRVLRNAQRLLQPLAVVNPYADELTFTAERTRTRRDHEKYLTLIDAIALLHQHQRTVEYVEESRFRLPRRSPEGTKIGFVRATLDDIALANRLAPELLGRSLDELPPQSRRVYEAIKTLIRERCDADRIEQRHVFFSRRDIRARLGWSVTQIRIHLDRLCELEYIAARFGRPGSAFQYELLTDCREPVGTEHIGLLDVENLSLRLKPDGKKGNLTGGWRPPARQVQSIEEQAFTVNLTACRERTSGAAVLAGVVAV